TPGPARGRRSDAHGCGPRLASGRSPDLILFPAAFPFFSLRSCRMATIPFPGGETRCVGRTRPINLTPDRGWRRMPSTPQIIDVSNAQLEEVLRRVELSLGEEDVRLIRAVFQSYRYVTDLVEDKNTSLRRLRQLLFGVRTEKTESVVGQPTDRPEATRP